MKVLLISHNCQSLTEGLPKAQFIGEADDVELRVLLPNRWNFYGEPRFPETPLNPSYRRQIGHVMWPWAGPAQSYLHWYPELGRLLRRFRPDVIDLWQEPWSLVSAQTCFLAREILPNVKIISETEQNIDKTLPLPFERFRTYTLKKADFLVGRSQEAIDHLRRKGYGGPARVVPNAVDTELFTRQSPAEREAVRQKLGWDGFIAGYCGRIVPEKGLLDMINALPLLPAQVKMAFIGNGEHRAQLQARAIQSEVEKRVRFLDAQRMEELPPLMGALDALVLPSRTTPNWKEQFGRVIIEAGACGVPVVGSDSGAIPEVVGDGGLIFPEGDVPALARAISKLHSEPEAARQMSQAGFRRAHEQFSWQQVSQQMVQIYREIAR
ncbi:Glycosyltransferase Family 4 [Abditibacterium utsteinense]|uniref:Glycosyltransferase Family 4 n=1 Tax=Abditibacterium utsteinense TaxID=1960156 RepID=A0A2S8SSD6_9BACT|nr:glycosyltransferase family 4 protein [Abditibacterium utsteinense]PQV63705.1 Glycosyltransferase Family 4 [Abditibacterium utsteinense]